jgi:hypothetical protein
LRRPTVLILQEQRHAIELQLAHIFGTAPFQSFDDPLMEGTQVLLIIGIVERDERKGMPDGSETLTSGVTDALSRTVRNDKFRMLPFKLLKPPEQPVVLFIRDLGPGEDVVQVVVPGDLGAKALDFLLDIHRQMGAQRIGE